MRLLNARTGALAEFIGSCPPYAILSHRWGAEEITLQDLTGINQCLRRGVHHAYEGREGYRKIKGCCSQAIQDGLEWVWVDTCCIDKTDSAELTEAINSMFRWYRESAVCYAYLSDVEDREEPRPEGSSFRMSGWFRRGWTLQELVAPSRVIFFTKSWLVLGERVDLSTLLEEVTRIPAEYLTGRNIQEASIAQKMSWAAERETTRLEDAAYSLLGIFGVNMPLLYGEGIDAFRRLQEEISARSEDQSLFAWGFKPHPTHASVQPRGQILAKSPRDFLGCEEVVTCKAWEPRSNSVFEMTKRGLRIELPLIYRGSNLKGEQTQLMGLLNCRLSHDFDNLIGIPLGRPFDYAKDRNLPIKAAAEDLLVVRYFGLAAELVPASLVRSASRLTIQITNGDSADALIAAYSDFQGPNEPLRSYPVLLKDPEALSRTQLACDASLEVAGPRRGPRNVIIRELRLSSSLEGTQEPAAVYFRYNGEGMKFIVQISFRHPKWEARMGKLLLRNALDIFSVAMKVYSISVSPRNWLTLFANSPHERAVQCQVCRVPDTDASDPSLRDGNYLRSLGWRNRITDGQHKIYAQVKRKKVMGTIMDVVEITYHKDLPTVFWLRKALLKLGSSSNRSPPQSMVPAPAVGSTTSAIITQLLAVAAFLYFGFAFLLLDADGLAIHFLAAITGAYISLSLWTVTRGFRSFTITTQLVFLFGNAVLLSLVIAFDIWYKGWKPTRQLV